MTIEYIKIPAEIYRLPVRGLYEVSILALIVNFGKQGLRLSNAKIAEIFSTPKRTVERAISDLKKQGYIRDIGRGKNGRCLVADTDKMSAGATDKMTVSDTDKLSVEIPTPSGANTDVLADHKERRKRREEIEEKNQPETQSFVDLWNSKRNLPRIKSFTGQRQKHFQARMRQPFFAQNRAEIIERISRSSFCTGGNDRGWRADIDWLLKNDTNFAKVLEGRYDNRRGQDDCSLVPAEPCEADEAERLRAEMVGAGY
jgi:hypothetical protein